jgi:preprotein translocase subunit SecD
LTDARVAFDNLGRPVVTLKFNKEGTNLFDELSRENIGRQVAILLDGVVISAPVVQERISAGEAQISGRFTTDEAQRLAIMLRAGALPVTVEILETRSIGPTLGADSIRSGVKAGLIGAALIFIFMIIHYSAIGLVADISLVITILLLLAGLASFKATLTLPGIAGIILTIGMAVDGNILIYERIKEELRSGKTIMASVDAGFRKAFITIIDANLTTLFAAVFLFYYGTGPIRGFAVTLSIGILASVFCAVFVTRVLLRNLISKRKKLLSPASKERS